MAGEQPSHHHHTTTTSVIQATGKATSSATNNPWPTSEPDKASCLHRSVNIPRDSALLSLSPGSTWSSSPPTDQRVWEQSLLHQGFYHPDRHTEWTDWLVCFTFVIVIACKSHVAELSEELITKALAFQLQARLSPPDQLPGSSSAQSCVLQTDVNHQAQE